MCVPVAALAAERFPGPVSARVLRVIDGDTLEVAARIWIDQTIETRVRLFGVDAPELHGRCASERHLAERARNFLRRRVGGGEVRLRDLRYDKYGGRMLARIETVDGEDLGATLLASGLARRYGGARRSSWCEAKK
jgi:micrococcal nuclease